MLELNRLYNMDCMEGMKMIDDNSIDMIFTDPPYGHNNNNGDLISRREAALGKGEYVPDRDNRAIMNDGKEADEIFKQMIPEMHRVLKAGCCCCCCCCGGGGPDPMFARWSLWLDEVFKFKQMIVWDKGPMGMGWHYRRSYETVLVAMKKGAACKWYDETHAIENIIRPRYKGIRKIIPSKAQHPTQKPVELAKFFIVLHSQEGETVLDPFAGSGTTLIAAKQMKRQYIGFELDKQWADIATARLEEAKNQTTLF